MKRKVPFVSLTLACCLAACSDAPDSGAPTNAARSSGEVDRYLASLTTADPEDCFKSADMRQADLRAGEGGATPVAPKRVMIAIDASGSMAGRVGSETKLALAKRAAGAFVDGLPATVEAGVLTFGQAGDNTAAGKGPSCRAITLTAPLGRSREALQRAVEGVRPVGWTPLAAALDRAATLLAASSVTGEQVIYVVSDGEETCGGDPVAAARRINLGGTRAVVNIIGFAVPDGEAAALKAVATAGGGTFVNTGSGAEVSAALTRIRESNRQAVNTIAAGRADARNTIASATAGAATRICVSRLMAAERNALSADIRRKRDAGQPLAIEEQARAALAQRHAELGRRAEDHVARLDAARADVNQRIERDVEAVR